MSDADLPPELGELEAALKASPVDGAAPAHRARVLGAVRNEIAAQNSKRPVRSFWRFAAGAAAALVLGCNLAMSAANDTSLRVGLRSDERETKLALARLREVLPELSDDDAQCHLLMLRARSELVGTPAPSGGSPFNRSTEEN